MSNLSEEGYQIALDMYRQIRLSEDKEMPKFIGNLKPRQVNSRYGLMIDRSWLKLKKQQFAEYNLHPEILPRIELLQQREREEEELALTLQINEADRLPYPPIAVQVD